jgi:hypothetical protein
LAIAGEALTRIASITAISTNRHDLDLMDEPPS